MINFTLALAGKAVGVTALFDETKEYCREYLCPRQADFSVSVTREDLAREQQSLDRKASEHYLERVALHRKIATKMLQYDTFLLHGSAVAVDGVCYVFIAPSGTGKSTHTRLWREKFGARALMVNDDKPLIRVSERGAYACGTPWNGKHRLGTPTEAKIGGICVLCRGQEDRIERLSVFDALPAMLEHSHYADIGEFLAVLDKLCRQVPFYRLHCTPTRGAVEVAYAAMKEN